MKVTTPTLLIPATTSKFAPRRLELSSWLSIISTAFNPDFFKEAAERGRWGVRKVKKGE